MFKWTGSEFQRVESGTRSDFKVLLVRENDLWLGGESAAIIHYAP